jgi:hypothetical protein
MPKVRILSGNEKGAVKDLPQTESENAVATGFAELVVEEPEKDESEEKPSKAAKETESEEDDDRPRTKFSGHRTERGPKTRE